MLSRMNTPTFRLFWLRETGCDAGVVIEAREIERSIRDRVMALTAGEGGEFALRLPYLDRYQWRRRGPILRNLDYEREGRLIRAILTPAPATRDLAATLALIDPAWQNTPPERKGDYHQVWHRVSHAVQRALKAGIAAEYFCDLSRLQSRDAAYTMIVYQSSRAYIAKSRHRFTYDLEEYPLCPAVVSAATTLIGARVEGVLEQLHQRLLDADELDLARRYTPAWHPDIVNAIRKKPRRFLDLLMREAQIVNAVIEMGTDRTVPGVHNCARKINTVLRRVQGVDMRRVGVTLLEAATEALTQSPGSGGQDVFDAGILQDLGMSSARRPDARIGSEKYGDDRDTHRGGQMSNPGIVTDIQTGGGEPTRQLI
jgi:hypothetical protein